MCQVGVWRIVAVAGWHSTATGSTEETIIIMTSTRRSPAEAPQPRGWTKGDGRVYRKRSRADGTLLPTWTALWWEHGTQQSKSGFRDPESAWAYITRQRSIAAVGTAVDVAPSMTLAEYVSDVYLPSVRAQVERGDKQPTTLAGYEATFGSYLTGSSLSRMRLRDITGLTIGQHLDVVRRAKTRHGQRVSDSTVAGHSKALSGVLSHAAQRGALPNGNPFRSGMVPTDQRVSAPKVAKRNEPVADWTLDHWHRLVTGMGDVQHGIGYVLAAGCALRRGEVAGLRWGDVDAEGATVRVERAVQVVGHSTRVAAPKTESGKRTVPLMPAVAEALESWRRVQRDALLAHGIRVTNSTPILTWITGGRSRGGQRPSEVGAPVHPQTLAAGCAKACEALGTPVVGLHGLRHVCITLGLTPREAGGFGWSPSVGAAFAGHADETITLRTYTHLSQRSVAAAVQDGYVQAMAQRAQAR